MAPLRPGVRVALLTAVLWAAALVLVAGRNRPPGLGGGGVAGLPEVRWWIFAVLFAVTEACVVQLRLRREAFSLSLSEAPLVIGLFLATPSELLVGRVVGSAAVFLAYRRQTALKAGFNTALVAAGTAVAATTFAALLPAAGHGPQAWTAALAATTAAGVVDSLALVLVVGWFGSPVTARGTLGEIGSSVAVSLVVGSGGLLALTALGRAEASWPLAVAAALVLVGYRAFAALADRHTSLERLYALSDALAASPAWDDVLASVLRQASDLLRAGYVEVQLAGHGPSRVPQGPQRWSLRAGGHVQGPLDVDIGTDADAGTATSTEARLVRPDDAPGRALLDARGLAEAVVVPLRVDDRAVGHLLVGDRTGAARFVRSDVRLLETVANHGAVALRNGRLIQRLHTEARCDELTGLPNRLSLRELLDAAAVTAADGGTPCSVMVLDFDGFKAVNDTLGHPAGDELLRVLAQRLVVQAAGDAVVARLGGDEFAVLSTRCTTADAAGELATRLLRAFDEPVAVAGTRLRLGGSLGIALGPAHGLGGADLLRHADMAMYAAKTSAGSARLFTPDLVATGADALSLASDLRDALADGAIDVAVQPLVELRTGALHSVEVLARWAHPELGDVPPEVLFAAADRSGQTLALSEVILHRALGLCRAWRAEGLDVRVAVNLAPRWLADAGLPGQVAAALERHDVPPDLLCLELREASVLADPRRTVDTLHKLRSAGVHLAVDDFGTGYSSLTYLTRLPVDQLKIDRSFVARLGNSPQDRTITRSIIDLGRTLGLEVVAEGVADEDARRQLLELGCGLGQGYLFAPPLDPAQLPAFARAGADSAPPAGTQPRYAHQP
jgi:diguanylate cyclase (GGDEF)-like protein